jgi:peroxiredoxin
MLGGCIAVCMPFLFATIALAADPSPMISAPSMETPRLVQPMQVSPRSTPLTVGDSAPMFSFMAADGRWHRSEELMQRGPVLIVFGATAPDLRALGRLRDAFRELGVTPVAVFNLPTRSTRALADRMNMSGPALADPMCAIAELYNSLDPANGKHAPSYFVVDDHRIIRALRHGALPDASTLLGSSARCLGLPLPANALSQLGG